MIDRHKQNCNCSYCGNGYNKRLCYGLNIPKDWAALNSWYVIKFWPNTYFRWTNSWIKKLSFGG